LVVGNIYVKVTSSTGVQVIKDNAPPGSVEKVAMPPPGSGPRNKASPGVIRRQKILHPEVSTRR
jgi:hypothetical protein